MKIKICLMLLCALFFSTATQATEISLREKIGQMLIIGFQGKTTNDSPAISRAIDQLNLGGVILFDFNQQAQTFDKNIATPDQTKQLNQQLQRITHLANKAHHRPNLPLLISVDYEGGQVNRLADRYGFPRIVSAKMQGLLTKEQLDELATVMAKTLHESGFNLNYYPVIDLNINPDNPIIGKKDRSFAAEPEKVIESANQFSDRFLAQHIECTYKHFPGHGSSVADSHLGFADVTSTWQTSELTPYLHLLAQPKHCGVIMVAHLVNRKLDITGLPASLSYPMITGLLRNELKFDGVVVSDDMQMKAIANYYGLEKALMLSINAGVDLLVFGNQLVKTSQEPKQLVDIIERKVLTGEISRERINQAYQRIIQLKKSLKSNQ